MGKICLFEEHAPHRGRLILPHGEISRPYYSDSMSQIAFHPARFLPDLNKSANRETLQRASRR